MLVVIAPAFAKIPSKLVNYVSFAQAVPAGSEVVYKLREYAAPTDRICVLGSGGNLYIESGRSASVRHIYQNSSVLRDADEIAQFCNEVMTGDAKAIVVTLNEPFVLDAIWPQLAEYVGTNYELVFQDDTSKLYVRN